MLEASARSPRIVDAEEESAVPTVREGGDERVVGVGDDGSIGRELRNRGPPALGDVLELAVAVELVTEEVAEAHDARSAAPHHLGQRELIDLEQPQIGVTRPEQCRRDPRGEVGAGVVPGKAVGGREDRARHRRRRRLPVRRRDKRHTQGKPGRERVERTRVELPDQLAGQRRAAAPPGRTREPPHEPGGGRLQREPCTHCVETTEGGRGALALLQVVESDLP